ncbi:hypothetical protein KS4_00400 [Poriferisphaera corsica]|uniref:Uncharacterized protein n=1 Tax=Poriferisphaera corsica TaxID=2528020 RepID=A0A517YP62_9BACT|nr:hypothetical protein KS4_00400 [Poriferisphaera corsica]
MCCAGHELCEVVRFGKLVLPMWRCPTSEGDGAHGLYGKRALEYAQKRVLGLFFRLSVLLSVFYCCKTVFA